MATALSALRDLVRTHLLNNVSALDEVYYFDGDVAVAASDASLLSRSQTVALLQFAAGVSDNLTGKSQTRIIEYNFNIVVVMPLLGLSSLNETVKALDDVAGSVHSTMQPGTFDPTVTVESGAGVALGQITPVTDFEMNYVGMSVPCTIKIPQ